MKTLPYQQVFERIRAEYLEMPEMRLTPEQLQRLSGVDSSVCRLVLDDLVRAKFLRIGPDGSYVRVSDGSRSRSPTTKPERNASPVRGGARRAS
jgi:hypothetical protein